MDAEKAHETSLSMLRLADSLGVLRIMMGDSPKLPVKVMGLDFANPVGMAAGMDKNGKCVDAMSKLGFGFIEVGTVTPRPQPGNPKPRLFRAEDKEAVVNRMGFNNDGVDRLLINVSNIKFDGILGINIGKNATTPIENALDDYIAALRKVHARASYVTINISSPNTKNLRSLQEENNLRNLLSSLVEERNKLDVENSKKVPLAVKIAPDLSEDEIDHMCEVFLEVGVDGIIATNTTIDKSSLGDHFLAGEAGGLSGRPLLERSNQVLARVKKNVGDEIDIVGVGGIMSPQDAIQKIELGAKAVQIISSLVYKGPEFPKCILAEMTKRKDLFART